MKITVVGQGYVGLPLAIAAVNAGYTVYAWCKPASLPLLLEKGFDEGETCTYVEKVIE